MEEPKIAAGVDVHRARELAIEFAIAIRNDMSADELAEAVHLNQFETVEGVCHTHDYCDANQSMLDAFAALFGRDAQINSDDDRALMDAAWQIAKYDNFQIHG